MLQAYKKDPFNHAPPKTFQQDMIWSLEVLHRVFRGEEIPRAVTIRGRNLFTNEPQTPRQVHPRLLDDATVQTRVKKKNVTTAFRSLKRSGPVQIDLSTPSPDRKRPAFPTASTSETATSSRVPSVVRNPEFPHEQHQDVEDEEVLSFGREKDDLEKDVG